MVIFGGRSKDLDMVYLEEGVCSACGANGVTLTITQPYLHIYYIPMFPVGKKMQAKCGACGRVYQPADFTPELLADAEAARKHTRSSPVLFAGLAIIAVILIGVAVNNQMKARDTAEYLANPARYDLIIMPVAPDPTYKYEIFRINGIVHDSVFISAGSVGYISAADAEEAITTGRLDRADYFGKMDAVSRAEFAIVAEKYKSDALVIRNRITNGPAPPGVDSL